MPLISRTVLPKEYGMVVATALCPAGEKSGEPYGRIISGGSRPTKLALKAAFTWLLERRKPRLALIAIGECIDISRVVSSKC